MTRYRVEWIKRGVQYFDLSPEDDIDVESYAEDVVFWDDPNDVDYDVYVEGEHGWEQV